MMMKHLSAMSASLAALACFGSPMAAFAQHASHPGFRYSSVPGKAGPDWSARMFGSYFTGLMAGFTETLPQIGGNADGSDLLPCLGANGSNVDCPTLGNPQIPFPAHAIVTGFPGYGFALQNTPNIGNGAGCDAFVNGTGPNGTPYIPCAQVTTYYEDNTNDSTDDLLWRVVVTQGGTVVFASGTFDFGPAGPSVKYPVHVVLYDDANLGYWPNAAIGPNNGNCSADQFYPLSQPAFPPGYYAVSANKTCGRPQPGLAKVVTETSLATPSYTQVTGKACTAKGVASPCYTVQWARHQVIHQNFNIVLN